MKQLGLYKKEKLCSVVAIDQLFGAGGAEFSRLAYPLRLVARRNISRASDAALQFLISVPKKRLHHAVDRVLMRRRIREAFRLSRRNFEFKEGEKLDVAFIFVGSKCESYGNVQRAMTKLLESLSEYSVHTDEVD